MASIFLPKGKFWSDNRNKFLKTTSITKAQEMPHTGGRKQSQQRGCEDCINRTGHHSQQRKAGDRIPHGLLCYWASTGRRPQETGPSMPTPFHQIATRLQNFKMKLIRFESIFWSVPHDLVS